ncbi:glycosyltransferase family 2 protein [Gulbenkiania mobilis]|uniref:Rhamnosyltransferase n=1 Tax=Gulbenkiania mobilis TaxID=397457 RepID=A0ABY2CYB1_GULMO|nr:rhamnosyltransferase [Gulbenkiania mobilis]
MVGAIIVLYHPDEPNLKALLDSLKNQVAAIYLIDNTPFGQIQYNESYFKNYSPICIYKSLGNNKGIAKAQNEGISLAIKKGCTHVLLLDQDSCPARNMVFKLIQEETRLKNLGRKVAAVGPLFIEQKGSSSATAIRHKFLHVEKIPILKDMKEAVETDHIIASGSLISVDSLTEIGLMMEELFIDWVDVEWGLRAKSKGYSCFITPSTIMKHSIGDEVVFFLGKKISLHSTTRNYYIVRNLAFLLRKNHLDWNWRSISILRIPKYIVFYTWKSNHKLNTLKTLTQALYHGLIGKTGAIPNSIVKK